MNTRPTDHLAAIIELASEDRGFINDQFPDPRNVRTAKALLDLAAYVRALADHHPAICVIDGIWEERAGNESVGPAFDRLLSRFRYNDPDEGYEDFLKELSSVLLAEFNAFGDIRHANR